VILISIDSLRPDHLGCYGYARNTSPTLDRLAQEGALFETVWSSTSWTLPAHAALFTSLPDLVHGCIHGDRWLDGSRYTLAEAFQDAGYHTAGFFSGPYLHPNYGLAQGFDSYHDCTSYADQTLAFLQGQAAAGAEPPVVLSCKDITNEIVLRAVTRWLERAPRGPFFLFIHMWDVHYEYIPPAPYDTMFVAERADPDGAGPHGAAAARHLEYLKSQYDGEIRWTDDTLAKLFARLAERGRFENAVIAVTADHGEAFGEHGLHGHHYTLFEEEVRVPLILRYPPAVPAGRRIPELAHLIDLAPTLLSLASLRPMPHALGRDLTPLLAGTGAPWPDTPVLSELLDPLVTGPQLALRTRTWKLAELIGTGRVLMFDLEKDPGEQRPLFGPDAALSPDEIASLLASTAKKLQNAARLLPVPTTRDTPPIPEMTEAHLRSLGYLK
ncbi:MAG: sulfatase, partial [Planctomycetes bacterium]|nr:sulfatase [Planctomycetota bacterium]